jgi:sugar fermentation stimulation protein A
VWLSRSDDPKRTLAHTLELVETDDGALTGVNTLKPHVVRLLEVGFCPIAGFRTYGRMVV